MSQVTVSDLHFDILSKIFRLLDVKSLKNATLTCKSWQNVIESECHWPLGYDALPSEQKMNFVMTTNRKFGTLEITGSRLHDDNRIRQILRVHGFTVRKLIIRESHVENLGGFANLLNFTPNLAHAVIRTISFDDGSDVLLDHALPDLKRLKNLAIDFNDQRIIKCFRKAKLSVMEIREKFHWTQHEVLVEFLLSQETLTSLTVLRTDPSPSIVIAMGKLNVPFPFRLTHLALSGNIDQENFYDDDEDQNALLRFVQSQAKHLRALELGFDVPTAVYELIFTSMAKLNRLGVLTSQLPRSHQFYDQLQANCNVRTITLLDTGLQDHQFLVSFFQKLPNVSSLIWPYENRSSGPALAMAQHLTKLESFSIYCIDKPLIDCVKFPNLKTLHIQYLRSKIDWNKFTRAHPQLTELTVERIDKESSLTNDDIQEITTNVDLHIIRLGVGFIADSRFFEIIQAKCKNLKVLELYQLCIPHELNHNVGINVFRFVPRL